MLSSKTLTLALVLQGLTLSISTHLNNSSPDQATKLSIKAKTLAKDSSIPIVAKKELAQSSSSRSRCRYRFWVVRRWKHYRKWKLATWRQVNNRRNAWKVRRALRYLRWGIVRVERGSIAGSGYHYKKYRYDRRYAGLGHKLVVKKVCKRGIKRFLIVCRNCPTYRRWGYRLARMSQVRRNMRKARRAFRRKSAWTVVRVGYGSISGPAMGYQLRYYDRRWRNLQHKLLVKRK